MGLKPMGNPALADKTDFATMQSHINVQRYFEVLLLLMLGTSFVTLASTGKLDIISVFVVDIALAVKLAPRLRSAAKRPQTSWRCSLKTVQDTSTSTR